MSASPNYFRVAFAVLLTLSAIQLPAVQAATSVQVYANDSCIVADEPIVAEGIEPAKALGWAGLVVGSTTQAIVSDVIRAFAGALRYLAAPKETTYVASSDLYLYQVDHDRSPKVEISPRLGCITVVAGTFANSGIDCTGQYEPVFVNEDDIGAELIAESRKGRSIQNVLRRANICLTEEPDYYFESRVEYSEDHTAFRLRGAGYQLNKLLSTSRKSADRAILKTVSLFEPSADGRGNHIASGWLNYGTLASGDSQYPETDGNVSGWTRVPPLSAVAARRYQAESRAYIHIADEIQRLEGAIIRQLRQIRSLEEQLESGRTDRRQGIVLELDRLKVRLAIDTAALDARRAEFDDIPGGVSRFMPVSLQVRMTESKSEARLLTWLADFLEANSHQIADTLTESGLVN